MKIKILFCLLLFLAIGTSCEKDITDYNIDPKKPTTVPSSYLLVNAQKTLGDRVQGISGATIFRVWSQHWTQSTYVDEANYDIKGRNPGSLYWRRLYTNVLQDLRSAKTQIKAEAKLLSDTEANKQKIANQYAIIKIIEAYAVQMLVDLNGDVPYSESVMLEKTAFPKYDDAKTIYQDLIKKVEEAQNTLAKGGTSFGNFDIYYAGNVKKWQKFANTLLLRMGMRLADEDPGLASTTVSKAVQNGVFESAADDAIIHYGNASPNTHPIYDLFVLSRRAGDYVAGETAIDLLSSLKDPRIDNYFDNNKSPYIGGPIGGSNAHKNFSHVHPKMIAANFSGAILQYHEALFFMAEAVERGFISGDAEAYYNKAITASILEWDGTPAEAAAYLAQEKVAYKTAPGDYKQKIGTQKWIALYNQGFEAWTEYRRLDHPAMKISHHSKQKVPTRMIYPLQESSVNGENYKAASQKIGGDELHVKLFWDVH